jgi:hypothetical protein
MIGDIHQRYMYGYFLTGSTMDYSMDIDNDDSPFEQYGEHEDVPVSNIYKLSVLCFSSQCLVTPSITYSCEYQRKSFFFGRGVMRVLWSLTLREKHTC